VKRIVKAVFPVAGMGTRFLPATKASPKEMLAVVDKPLVQYAADEALSAGVRELIFVTGRHKRSIEDHFDKSYELEAELASRGKRDLLEIVRNVLPDNAFCVYTRQPDALGLGHAVLCAKPVVGDDAFAVLLADDLIDAHPGVIAQMATVYEQYGCSVIGVQNVPRDETGSYGIVRTTSMGSRLHKVEAIVEKPSPDQAPSTMAVVGRYILTPAIFSELEQIGAGSGGEIQLTDAISRLLAREQVLAYEFEGKRYDCGNKLGYLEATVELALKHPDLHADFASFLRKLSLD